MDLMSLESKYFEMYVKMNKQYSRLNYNLRSLLNVYELNIQQKFTLIYFKLFNVEQGGSTSPYFKYEEAIRKFQISFSDFRMDSYIRNFNTIYEVYFPLTKITSYRSKLELMYGHKLD